MAYDLLIKNGRIVDGSGMPAFNGDLGVKDGKIVEIGKLSGPAAKTIDAGGRVVAPGFVDNHCHYDAQVTWDPLVLVLPDHGCTTVVFGNCSLALAPVRPGTAKRVAEFLKVMPSKPSRWRCWITVEVYWETIPNTRTGSITISGSMWRSDRPLTVRYYVMGDDAQGRPPPTTKSRRCRTSCATA